MNFLDFCDKSLKVLNDILPTTITLTSAKNGFKIKDERLGDSLCEGSAGEKIDHVDLNNKRLEQPSLLVRNVSFDTEP